MDVEGWNYKEVVAVGCWEGRRKYQTDNVGQGKIIENIWVRY